MYHLQKIKKAAARDEVITCGGSISHHHGIGKIRKRWLPETIGTLGISIMKSLREQIDPENLFDSGNIFKSSSTLPILKKEVEEKEKSKL